MKADANAGRMTIVELRAENFMRLSAVTIRPSGPVVKVSGRNGQGKTSVLTAIASVLAGKTWKVSDALKHGEAEGAIQIVTQNPKLKATMIMREGAPDRLVLEDSSGRRISKPVEYLASMMGDLTMDPLEFIRMKAKDQLDQIKMLVPEIDFAAIAAAHDEDYAERTVVGREVKRMMGAIDEARARLPEKPKALPAGETLAELEVKLNEAHTLNSATERRRIGREQAADEVEKKRDEAEDLRRRAKALDGEADALALKLDEAEPLPDLVDVAAMINRIQALRGASGAGTAWADYERLSAQAQAKEKEHATLDARIKERESTKRRLIEESDIGKRVPGIGFAEDGGGITLNDVPFEQGSMAEKLKASFDIAVTMNPQSGVILIREGSLLDADSQAYIQQRAEKEKFQVWMEIVGQGEVGGIVIEDGAVMS